MTDTTTAPALDLDAIRKRLDAATPAPWTAHPDGLVWSTLIGDPVSGSVLVDDAEFIAHARQDIPDLVAEVDRLRAEVEHTELHPTGTVDWLKNRVNELVGEADLIRAELASFKQVTVTAGEQLYLHQCPGRLITRWFDSQPQPSHMECCDSEGQWRPVFVRAATATAEAVAR